MQSITVDPIVPRCVGHWIAIFVPFKLTIPYQAAVSYAALYPDG
jgi:hypothetical protein